MATYYLKSGLKDHDVFSCFFPVYFHYIAISGFSFKRGRLCFFICKLSLFLNHVCHTVRGNFVIMMHCNMNVLYAENHRTIDLDGHS